MITRLLSALSRLVQRHFSSPSPFLQQIQLFICHLTLLMNILFGPAISLCGLYASLIDQISNHFHNNWLILSLIERNILKGLFEEMGQLLERIKKCRMLVWHNSSSESGTVSIMNQYEEWSCFKNSCVSEVLKFYQY